MQRLSRGGVTRREAGQETDGWMDAWMDLPTALTATVVSKGRGPLTQYTHSPPHWLGFYIPARQRTLSPTPPRTATGRTTHLIFSQTSPNKGLVTRMRCIAYLVLKVRKSYWETPGKEIQMGSSLSQKQWAMTLVPSRHESVLAKRESSTLLNTHANPPHGKVWDLRIPV